MKHWTVFTGEGYEVSEWLNALEQESERLEVASATTTIDTNGNIYLTVLVSYWEEEEE